MIDKEIPWEQIKPSEISLYKEAEDKEWNEWQQRGSARIMTPAESRKAMQTVEPSRIIGLRFVYRDKNASVRTPQTPLPVKAKARLCAQAFNEPLARAGLIKVDSPT